MGKTAIINSKKSFELLAVGHFPQERKVSIVVAVVVVVVAIAVVAAGCRRRCRSRVQLINQ